MKCNINTVIFHPLASSNVVLVPYARHHVPVKLIAFLTTSMTAELQLYQRYNEWMQSEELRELTASEPLSLDEEYDMQGA
jgi:hypothetical protein